MNVHISPPESRQGKAYDVAKKLAGLRRDRETLAEGAVAPARESLKLFGGSCFTDAGLPPDARRLSLEELTRHDCAWPVGDGEPMFCGAPVSPLAGSRQRRRYCAFHGELATAGQVWPTGEKPPKEARR